MFYIIQFLNLFVNNSSKLSSLDPIKSHPESYVTKGPKGEPMIKTWAVEKI